MSTTTGLDLINRADQLARELSRCELPVDTQLWESLDTTAYRLMRELIGPGRDDAGASTRRRAILLRVIHAYPTPVRPPLDADFSVAEARRFVTVSREVLIRRIREGEVPTHVVGGQPRIDAAHLDARTDITPTDPADPHPLARLSTTLGVLADMVNHERRHPGTVDGLSDDAVRDAAARVMSWLAVAGRYTLRHGPIENGDRPLAVAQYADRSIDALGGTARSMAALDALAARVPTLGSGLSEQLDSRLHRWASAAREELQRTVPATQVMANIASVGTLMLASTHRLHTLSPSTPAEALVTMTSDLRGAADALKEAEATWKRVTTLQPQGRAFGAASFELFDTLRKVLAAPIETEKRQRISLDVDTSLRSLEQGTRDLARFVDQSHDVTRACLNSELLFAPARAQDRTVKHLVSRTRGDYLPLAPDAANHLMESIERAASLTAVLAVDTVAVAATHASLAVRR
ncbi:hypothetical protein SAMN04489867_1688 [Pedococcus dokdonensis]|uniref:Uncharacterized protein n=1 Tax=Pedococcus dokdonensis TaxID=443156 RepID=A0A1H0QQ93_9MICO|nr:hypothetical protein [Pedococcus dokdonensis]SDP19285.1 hypothetical protein SAMN04489867_1688 [Pedococcus dokdonensis]